MFPSTGEVVARFLRSNGYDKTLAAFITEAGLPPDAGTTSKHDSITIEKVLEEKQAFDLVLNFEKVGLEDGNRGWNALLPPSLPSIVDVLPTSSNLLNVSIESLSSSNGEDSHRLIYSSADRQFCSMQTTSPKGHLELDKTYDQHQDSPVLAWVHLDHNLLLTGSMSGKLRLFDLEKAEVIHHRQDHTKYVVRVVKWKAFHGTYIATAGWDCKINLYHTQGPTYSIGAPIATLTVTSVPETILFMQHPDSSQPILLLTRRNSTSIFYYAVPDTTSRGTEESIKSMELLGRQNLAPHSNAWVAFTPACIAVSPRDPSIVAVATSQEPHMKLMIVRLLIPPLDKNVITSQEPTQASQARTELLVADREEAAIMISCNTMASQTAYSTPILVWRPDGSGVWVNSDDGVIRGVDSSSGKVVAQLKGHTSGTRIRCLWAGYVNPTRNDNDRTEWLVSGGFDQKLIIWYPDERKSGRDYPNDERLSS
ncbi:WD40 repeat-like protein [Pseudovirgaria hyperparasitica]|uniref:WD40 repeat-like protein n=1 Tax=Pseudovirgaria hyperparasitica TaxID=470096 RepID=A0A6A6W2I3_9PEZI|nr:WD40 repeat-like protein [Pseudovirgaria hyperparasitica]KAF2756339.1 WD40 repeat-like protein [Pseudovirgaria hyperparasitica]